MHAHAVRSSSPQCHVTVPRASAVQMQVSSFLCRLHAGLEEVGGGGGLEGGGG